MMVYLYFQQTFVPNPRSKLFLCVCFWPDNHTGKAGAWVRAGTLMTLTELPVLSLWSLEPYGEDS